MNEFEFAKSVFFEMKRDIPEITNNKLIRNIAKLTGASESEVEDLVKDDEHPFTIYDLVMLCFWIHTTPNDLLGFDICSFEPTSNS